MPGELFAHNPPQITIERIARMLISCESWFLMFLSTIVDIKEYEVTHCITRQRKIKLTFSGEGNSTLSTTNLPFYHAKERTIFVHVDCAVLSYYVANSGNLLRFGTTFESIGCFETSLINCHHSLLNDTEVRSFH